VHVSWIRVSFLARAKISTSASSPMREGGDNSSASRSLDRYSKSAKLSYHISIIIIQYALISSESQPTTTPLQ
jgi:hypothetical protein